MIIKHLNKLQTVIIIFAITSSNVFGQVKLFSPDTLLTDSLKVKETSVFSHKDFSDIWMKSNIVNTNFYGFADAFRNNTDLQIFDFMDLGYTRFIAWQNMFPQQTRFYIDGISVNDYISGMFNTRLLSLDHVDRVVFQKNDSLGYSYSPGLYTSLRNDVKKNAYTRLKFYEGDFQYTDLDILFASRFSDDIQVRLAGFNKGFEGSGINNSQTSVNYNALIQYKINNSTKAEFSWILNHERSGMESFVNPTNYIYARYDITYGLRFIFKADTLTGNDVVLGIQSKNARHSNRSQLANFKVKDRSDDYKLYITKNVQNERNKLSGTFSLNNYNIWGTVFDNRFTETRFALKLTDIFTIRPNIKIYADAEIEYLNDYNPQLNISSGLEWQYSKFKTKADASIYQRFPNPLEREYSYQVYRGNPELESEQINRLSLTQIWLPLENLLLQGKVTYTNIDAEINLENNSFINGPTRDWISFSGSGKIKFWVFNLLAGVSALSADTYISPKQSLWGQLLYHDNWFNKIIIDISLSANWYDRHNKIFYDPIIQRFYSGSEKNESYSIYNLKLVGTISDAEIFFEMENLAKNEIKYIEGYPNKDFRTRFGVNWVLWD